MVDLAKTMRLENPKAMEYAQNQKMLNANNEMVKSLKNIEENTKVMFNIIELLEQGSEQREVLIEILIDINAIKKCSDKDVKDGMFKKVAERINSLGGTISGSKELILLAQTALNIQVVQ